MEPTHKRTFVLIPAPKPAPSGSDSDSESDMHLAPVSDLQKSPKRVQSLNRLPKILPPKAKLTVVLKRRQLEPLIDSDSETGRLLQKVGLKAVSPISANLSTRRTSEAEVSHLPEKMPYFLHRGRETPSKSPVRKVIGREAYKKRQSLPKLSFRKWTFMMQDTPTQAAASTPLRGLPRQPSFQYMYRSKLQRDPLLRKSPLGIYQYVDARSLVRELKYAPERIAEYKQIRAYLRCKSTIYQYLRFRQQAVLLNYPTVDMKFLMQLITGVKKFITRDKLVQNRSKPRFALDKRQLYRLCTKHPVISQYLPNRRNMCKTELMCKLAQVLDPEMYQKEILSAKGIAARRDKSKIKQKLPKTISCVRDYANILLKMPVANNGEEESLSTRMHKPEQSAPTKNAKAAEEFNLDQDQDKKE